MVRKSIFIDELPNEKDHTDFEKYRYYACGLKIEGEDYTAKIVIGEKNGQRYYDHRLSQIEKGRLIDSLNGLSNTVAENKTAPVSEPFLAPMPDMRSTNDSDYKGMTLERLLQIPDEKCHL